MQSNHGFLWKLLNSWWIIPSFFFMACVGFFYIGKKAKKKIWTITGVLYLVVLAVLFYLDGKYNSTKAFTNAIAIFYIVGIIHSFYVRGEYLRIICANDEIVPPQPLEMESVLSHSVMSETANEFLKPNKEMEHMMSKTIIDINSCEEKDFTSLPGVSIVMAKRAITYREEHNGFSSKEEFYDTIQLKPHFIVQVQELVECSPLNNQAIPKEESTGRKLDL